MSQTTTIAVKLLALIKRDIILSRYFNSEKRYCAKCGLPHDPDNDVIVVHLSRERHDICLDCLADEQKGAF